MKKGKVTSEILTYAGSTASERAQSGLPAAQRASQAEQQRYQNSVNDLAVIASNAGVEEGFSRIFRTLNAGLSESNGLIKSLAEGFNEATKFADDLLLWPQSFIRALEGRDSLVADWLGADRTRQLIQDWQDIRDIWTQITAVKAEDIFGDFLPSLQSTSKELQNILNTIAEVKRYFASNGSNPAPTTQYGEIEKIDPFGFGAYTSPVGILKAAASNFGSNIDKAKARQEALRDPNSIYYNDPAGYDSMQTDLAGASPQDRGIYPDLSRYNSSTPEERADFEDQQRQAAMADEAYAKTTTVNNDIRVQLNIDPVTLGQLNIQAQAQELAQAFAQNLEQVLVQFPQKE